MSILIVVAHPDDEVLGCGGTAAKLAQSGAEVHACILSGSADARLLRPEIEELHQDLQNATEILGISGFVLGEFPNIAFNTCPHIDLVRFIEEAVARVGATTIFTHHPNDLNDDHKHTSLACMAASRLYQRRSNQPALERLFAMEILSSTDWAYSGHAFGFEPDAFFEIGEDGLEQKIEALKAYRNVPRPFPHPRSEEVLRGLAAYRGGQANMRYAEGFQTLFCRLNETSFQNG